MGDRANVAIVQWPNSHNVVVPDNDPPAIFVYTHWGGARLPLTLQKALARSQPRWGDDPYATHILIDQLTVDTRDQETGCGISLEMGDNSHPVLVVDLAGRRVLVISEGDATLGHVITATAIREFTFAEYLALDMSGPGYNMWGNLLVP